MRDYETHFPRGQDRGETYSFCGSSKAVDFDPDVDAVTCTGCLDALIELGEKAEKRREEFFACTDCGENGFGFHACSGRSGESE